MENKVIKFGEHPLLQLQIEDQVSGPSGMDGKCNESGVPVISANDDLAEVNTMVRKSRFSAINKFMLFFAMILLLPLVVSAHWEYTFHESSDKYDHNHYSNETWHDGTVMAGTMFDTNSTATLTHIMELDALGNIVWENTYDFDFGEDNERCFDICVISDEHIAVTGTANGQLFVAVIDAGGTVMNSSYFTVDIGLQSVGLSILYSEVENALFVGGYASPDITSTSANAIGILMSMDVSLNLNWQRQMNYGDQAMVSDLTELPNTGIYVTGKLLEQPGQTFPDRMLSALYDYGGNKIWDRSFVGTAPGGGITTGADAVYDEEADELFVLLNYSPWHSFAIQKIVNASTSGPGVVYVHTNDLLNNLELGNYAGFDMAFDPNDGNLLVAGMTYYQRPDPTSGPVDSSPTFLAKVDRNDARVHWLKLQLTDNLNFRTHDHDIFQAFYSTHPYISHPDLLTILDHNTFQLIGYQTNVNTGTYGVNVITTDANGDVMDADDCQQSTNASPIEIVTDYVDFDDQPVDMTTEPIFVDPEDIIHIAALRCASSCEVTVNGFSVDYVDCYTYEFTANASVTTGPGAVTTYEWDWGDGSTSSTSGPVTTHGFSAFNCWYNVCLVVNTVLPDGTMCTDTSCMNVPMLVEEHCGGCGWSQMENKAIDMEKPLKWKMFPNPVKDILTIQFEEEVNDGILTLYNMTGQEVRRVLISETTNIRIDVSDLPAGVYTLQSNNGTSIIREMVVVK